MSYVPPAASAATVSSINFSLAASIAEDFVKILADFDKGAAKGDPSKCAQILKFPSGAIFWASKMAVDADGIHGKLLDSADGQNDTNFHFADKTPLDSRIHPFIVLPQGVFGLETKLALGDVVAVVYKNQITGGIFGDLGPHKKIGEASIAVHEGLRPAAPDCCHRDSKGACIRIIDVSIPQDVLYFAFPHSAFAPGELTSQNMAELVKARAYALFQKLSS